MRRMGWILVLGLIGAVPAASAQSITGGGGGGSVTGGNGTIADGGIGGPRIGVFTRTIGGRRINQGFLLLNRGDGSRRGKRRSSEKSLPRCRRGLFGRVVNKTKCRDRRRSGGVQNGQRY